MMGYGFGMGIWGLLGMSIFWIVLIVLVVWLVRSILRSANKSAHNEQTHDQSAEEILEVRYAWGELSEEQYHKMIPDIH